MLYYMASFESSRFNSSMVICVNFNEKPRLRVLLAKFREALGDVKGMDLVDFWEATPAQIDRWWQEGDRPDSAPDYEPIAA